MRARLGALSAATLAITGLVTGAGAAQADSLPDSHPVAVGFGGAVVSDTAQATQAGIDILRRGGTAADAAVAVAATLGVTDPFVAGIGGGGYFVYYDAHRHKVSVIDGRETTPRAADQNLFIDPATGEPYDFPTAVTSGLSVGVPGNLATWERALQRFGRFSLGTDLRPAIEVAEQGFPVDATFHEQVRENQKRFAQFSSTADLFLPGGAPPAVGSTLRNPDLADTYRDIARHGTDVLYGGSVGRDVVDAVHHLPLADDATLTPIAGKMSLRDLARYRTVDRDATHVGYRGYDVYGMPPSSSGGITGGEALNIMENFDMSSMDRVQALHHYLEASKIAFADRGRYIGDTDYVDVPQKQLLSDRFAKRRACLIDPAHALPTPVAPGDPYAHGGGKCKPGKGTVSTGIETHTNHLVVSDRWGNVVSYTNTIEQLGGSGIVVPGRGFLLNNELTDFNFAPPADGTPDPNLPESGKRPRSSMSPTIVLHHGKPFLAVGSPGGASIITTVLQILVNRLDFGMDLESAIAAPRASQRNSATTQVEPEWFDLPTTPGLEALGHSFAIRDTSPLDPTVKISPEIGAASGLEFRGHGLVIAAGEPVRRGGSSAAVVHPVR